MVSPPQYPHAPIYSARALAKALHIDVNDLEFLALHADEMYFQVPPQVKRDGTLRALYDTRPALKRLLKSINSELLKKVEYPAYLQGSLPKRDYKSNAELHVGASLVVSLDVKSFFPSTTSQTVCSVWRGVFGFNEEVANLLTSLTCRNGVLGEGAPCSSYIANLVFWSQESSLVSSLKERGFTYSRYVDDITISSHMAVTQADVEWAIGRVYAMLGAHGYKPKRSKEKIMRRDEPVILTNLIVNTRAALPKKERSRIRAVAYNAKQALLNGTRLDVSPSQLGQIYTLRRFHPREAQSFLDEIKRARLIVT